MVLIIDRRSSALSYKAGCLNLERKGLKTQQVPIRQLEQVIVYGNPVIDAAALRCLAEAGVPVILLTSQGREQVAMLGSGLATQLPVRRLQHMLANTPSARLEMAKWFIEAKFRSYDIPLETIETLYHPDGMEIEAFNQQRTVTLTNLSTAASIPAVRGLEGQLAHSWFALLARVLPDCWKFAGRNRQPPRDPVNGLLSLSYTILLSEVRQGVLINGFDPSLGFLHQDCAGRESLALDILEMFRAGADAFVLRWIKDTKLSSDNFYYRKTEGCRMSKVTRPLFFQAWAQYRDNWPTLSRQEQGGNSIRYGSIRETINGRMAETRDFMKKQEQ